MRGGGVAIWLNVVLNEPRVAFPYVKVQVRELVRVVGIVAPFAPLPGANLFYRAQGVNWHRRSVSGAPSSGTPRKSQEKFKGQDRVGIVEGSTGYRARGVKVQVWDLMRGVEIVAPFYPTGFGTQGKCFEPQGVNGLRKPVPDAPSSGAPRKSRAKFRDGTKWRL